jgi:hypothetical protein
MYFFNSSFKGIFLTIFFIMHLSSYCQDAVGIGNTSVISENILLEIASVDKGLIIPRMTSEQRNNITNPADGLIIYDINQYEFSIYNAKSSVWESISPIPESIVIPWFGDRALFDSSGLGLKHMSGWAICNGDNNTPDMTAQFLVGYSSTDIDYNNIGPSSIGMDSVSLKLDELPVHTHDYLDFGHTHEVEFINQGEHSHTDLFEYPRVSSTTGSSDDGSLLTYIGSESIKTVNTDKNDIKGTINEGSANLSLESSGMNGYHENRPKFKVLIYIIKL